MLSGNHCSVRERTQTRLFWPTGEQLECLIHSQCGNNAQSVRFAVAATDSPPDLLSLELLQMGAEVQLLHIWGHYGGVIAVATR